MGKLITGPGMLHFADRPGHSFLALDARGVYLRRGLIYTWAQLTVQDGVTALTIPWREVQTLEITDGTIDAFGGMDGHLQVSTTDGLVRSSRFTGFFSVDAFLENATGAGSGRRTQVRFAEPTDGKLHHHLRGVSFHPNNAV